MQYNILNYRNHYETCDTQTNNENWKEDGLSEIVKYAQADLFAFNELSNEEGTADSLLQNVFMNTGLTQYKLAPFSGINWLANAVIYNEEKLIFYQRDSLDQYLDGGTILRRLDRYIFYLNTSELKNGDTLFLNVYVVHLKSGSSELDANLRSKMASALVQWHLQGTKGYSVLMGDLNVRSSGEDAYGLLISNQMFEDVLLAGEWNGQYRFSSLHTQSTRSLSNGCFSGGGLDDRYDFILLDSNLLNTTSVLKYVDGSMQALGNDGNSFNKAFVNSNVVPLEIREALYEVSDHLPVICELSYGQMSHIKEIELAVKIVQDGPSIKVMSKELISLEVSTVWGQNIYRSEDKGYEHQVVLPSGVYWVVFSSGNSHKASRIVVTASF